MLWPPRGRRGCYRIRECRGVFRMVWFFGDIHGQFRHVVKARRRDRLDAVVTQPRWLPEHEAPKQRLTCPLPAVPV